VKVRLLFFAVLRDITGKSEADITVDPGTTPRHIWQQLRAQHPQLAAWLEPPMTAINEDYASPDAPLSDRDELAFIPPVAGG
jgi:molybdopterin converting factor subunit 1